jgi:DGQHR domain-containing protein
LDINPAQRSNVNRSPQLHALGGSFAMGNSVIPYFTTHMTLAEVATCLKTPNELPGWSDEDVEIEGLFQRQLDYRRVNKKILPYLRNESNIRPRFFNSLTVALTPYRDSKFVEFDNSFDAPDLLATNTSSSKKFGPITIGFYGELNADDPSTYAVTELCWNPDQVACVAIDGQHRLHALKRLHSTAPEYGTNTKISVILIVPSPELGYSTDRFSDGLLPMLRSIFIDLNKHSVPVKRSRLVLLDDIDPHSILVRRTIESRLSKIDPTDIGGDRIPLGLVDWHGDDAKFDNGPYITTVLMLDRIVEHLISATSVRDWTDKNSVRRQLDGFKRLGFEPSESLVDRYEDFRDSEETRFVSFGYDEDDLKAIEESVGTLVAKIINMVLLGIRPYRDLIELRDDHRMLSPDFVSWYAAYTRSGEANEFLIDRTRIADRIRNKNNPPNIDDWENCLTGDVRALKQDNLLFKVVFQDALFQSLSLLRNRELPVIQDSDLPAARTPEYYEIWAEKLVMTINALIGLEENFFSPSYTIRTKNDQTVRLWLGMVVDPSSMNIDFTKGAAHRASQFIDFCVLVFSAQAELRASGDCSAFDTVEAFSDYLRSYDGDYVNRIDNFVRAIVLGNEANPGSQIRVERALVAVQGEAAEDEEISARAVARFSTIADHIVELAGKAR